MADSIKAHAKINLHLEVLNRRDDGYHEIFSLMAGVALHDLLKLERAEVRAAPGDINISVLNGGGTHGSVTDSIPSEKNLIARAADLYCRKAGLSGSVVFSVVKNIPTGAGLAGGSSDAAASLKLLNARFNAMSDEDLFTLASCIGADVPFCLRGGVAMCRGIGEIVVPVPGMLRQWVVIVNDGIHIDTGAAYRALGRETGTDRIREHELAARAKKISSAVFSGSLETLKGLAKNDFEEPVFRQHPEIGRVKEELLREKADFAIMTGSGSSVIALYSDRKKARRAQAGLKGGHREVILTKFL